MSQFRALYPEYAPATDDAVARKVQQTFFPDFGYEGFADGFLHKNASFGFPNFVIADLFLKRSDANLRGGNWHAAKLDFRRAGRGYPDAPDAIDRWREISPSTNGHVYVDLKTFNDERREAVNFWIKQAKAEDGSFSVDQYELKCGTRRLRKISSNSYDSSGSLIGSHRGNSWMDIVPDSLGEGFFNGACAN